MARDNRSKVFFVELKTDAASRRDQQDIYLERASAVGLAGILQGLIEITHATTAKHKYGHLVAALAERGCLSASESYRERLWGSARSMSPAAPEFTVTVNSSEFAIEVLYIEPISRGSGSIGFAQVAQLVGRHGDPLSHAFAAHLLRWVDPAGSVRPGAFPSGA